jgi:hypothetical protein
MAGHLEFGGRNPRHRTSHSQTRDRASSELLKLRALPIQKTSNNDAVLLLARLPDAKEELHDPIVHVRFMVELWGSANRGVKLEACRVACVMSFGVADATFAQRGKSRYALLASSADCFVLPTQYVQ